MQGAVEAEPRQVGTGQGQHPAGQAAAGGLCPYWRTPEESPGGFPAGHTHLLRRIQAMRARTSGTGSRSG